MELQDKNEIYDRLLTISLKIDLKNIPDPRYINEKIGQCHVFIEEVEKFFIKVNREMSVVQRALNDALASFENSRDTLISTDDEIKTLPSQKDRESRANMVLKNELNEIKKLRNELSDLENIQKAVNLKIKNLTRLNTDIKTQLKLMDSQIRLGTPNAESPAARSLAEELSKATMGMDFFEEAETAAEESTIVDPTEPINMDQLLNTETVSPENVEPLIDNLSSVSDPLIQTEEVQEEERSISERLLDPMPTDPEDDLSICMPTGAAGEETDASSAVVDLDKVLISEPPTLNPGGDQKEIVEPKIPIESTQKETQKPKNPDDIDIEALLSQFN